MAVSTIEAHGSVATLINVFTVEPRHQRELVDQLNETAERVMLHQPGFVSASVHASLDGRTVVNYAQWESEDAFNAMLADPTAQEHMRAASALATAEPKLHTVEAVHHA